MEVSVARRAAVSRSSITTVARRTNCRVVGGPQADLLVGCARVDRNSIIATKLESACAVLKLLGADRADTLAPTTAEEVDLRLRVYEDELRKCQTSNSSGGVITSSSIDVTHNPGAAPAATGGAGRLAPRTGGQS
jgi:hypothetical protein